MRKMLVVAGFFLAVQWSCKEKYHPEIESLPTGYLVVESNIATGGGISSALLSRTVPLDDTTKLVTEDGAQVSIEGKDNSIQALQFRGGGYYEDSGLTVIAGDEYRLHIKLGAKDYYSDYVQAKISPPIDSVGWKRDDDGVEINVSTHDDSKQTGYYRWVYEEVWETRARYFSSFVTENGVLRKRIFPEEDVYTCWKYNNSSNFLIANSTLLNEDKISQRQLSLIVNSDDRLSVKYSILVKQYALQEGAYNFFQLMKRNTDDMGSIYSPQPSEIRGNIHCTTNPSEYVMGYVTASSVTEKRIYIYPADVPDWGDPFECVSLKITDASQVPNYYYNGLVVYNIDPLPPPALYLAEPRCVDCTVTGGTKNKPSFW